jgi:hypothetical protein
MDTPAVNVANVMPGDANAQIAGPFDWTPSIVGHECVLAIVECAQDVAVTQTLQPGEEVEHSVLVPFDNNVAQRNLAPVPAKTGGARGFSVRNPYDRAVDVELALHSELPDGWRAYTGLASSGRLRLQPREQRWIEVRLQPPAGAPGPDPGRPYPVRWTALVEGMPIGGMTFYLAPPSAFAAPVPGIPGTERPPAACVQVPWAEMQIEGTARLRMRFDKLSSQLQTANCKVQIGATSAGS